MAPPLPNLSIDANRLWSTLDRSSEIGKGPNGGLRRLALSDSDKEMRDQFVAWCQGIGCTVTVDATGSIFAISALPRLVAAILTLISSCISSRTRLWRKWTPRLAWSPAGITATR